MAQRPFVWALGVAFFVGFGALHYATQLARLSGVEDQPQAAALAAPAAEPARPVSAPTLTVAADARGHYLVHPSIDNFRIKMMVDSGASFVALTDADARALGIRPGPSAYTVPLRTANGTVHAARANLREVRLGDILVRNVEAVVLPAGALGMSLLGTSFLGKLQGYEVRSGSMILRG